MTEETSPESTKKTTDSKWIFVGCGLVILFVIALVVIVFWLGTEAANPWGKSPGPGP